MSKARAPKKNGKKPEPKEYFRVLTVRVSDQEIAWLDTLKVEFQKKQGLKANASEIVRMLIRKAVHGA